MTTVSDPLADHVTDLEYRLARLESFVNMPAPPPPLPAFSEADREHVLVVLERLRPVVVAMDNDEKARLLRELKRIGSHVEPDVLKANLDGAAEKASADLLNEVTAANQDMLERQTIMGLKQWVVKRPTLDRVGSAWQILTDLCPMVLADLREPVAMAVEFIESVK
jgi:hypothetical protein